MHTIYGSRIPVIDFSPVDSQIKPVAELSGEQIDIWLRFCCPQYLSIHFNFEFVVFPVTIVIVYVLPFTWLWTRISSMSPPSTMVIKCTLRHMKITSLELINFLNILIVGGWRMFKKDDAIQQMLTFIVPVNQWPKTLPEYRWVRNRTINKLIWVKSMLLNILELN